ncbi:Pimeloyl-ACP methyl ester carboxylesterase [Curtobacterium sp. UNCCL20]|uniref:alpha/beta fold hydrolase n=1 Tax=Curtobacterium sp. UNCCL20 TaxID=1502773 RepID=UPI00087F99E1|nr:alpha/beta hydrolase [Curtobacterium sp. UNCCL20]SDQ85612.1 Pimeloyl-ACP methyl ester carboxylesterase [Curtobacterium sp. UNCCL20]
MSKPTIVLVHGAWADGSSWDLVTAPLQEEGYTVLVPPNPLRGVASDAAAISSFVEQRTTGPVVVVGHSYGGFVITNAAFSSDVRALVYVDGFIPAEGEFVFQLLSGSGSALDVPDPSTVLDLIAYPGSPEGDLEAYLKPETVHTAFAQDLPERDRALVAARQRPITLSANTAPSGPPSWADRPVWAVIGTEDLVIPPAVLRSMAERAGATITEVAASHVSMVSHPEVALAAITAAAAVAEPAETR